LNWIFIVLLVASISTFLLYQFFGDIDLDKTTIGVPGFAAVSIFTGISYVGFIVPLNYIKLQRDKNAGSGLILLGIVLTIGTLVVHSKKFSLGPHLNYNVLAHIILIFCYYLYYSGMRKKIRGHEDAD
jgi:peptidoglycan/LPS O-acetylase OafA/YrhL